MKAEPLNISSDPDGIRMGLCFSGGGFRAAFYALGVMRYLAEAGRLPNVETISAVSGGAVAAAALADRWPALQASGFSPEAYAREVEAPFRSAVTEHNIRNEAIRQWTFRRATLRGPSRGSAMGEVLVKRLLVAEKVTDLDPTLQVILTSTDLTTGRAFRVSREFIGSFDFDYAPVPPHLLLGTAVAASAAVPLLFPPIYVPSEGLGLKNTPKTLALVDGGVYDNLGLEWFQGWSSGRPDAARPVDFTVVVDASGPLERYAGRLRGLNALRRGQDIQYFQTRASRVRWFVDQLIAGSRQGVYVPARRDPRAFRLPDGTPVDPALYDGGLPSALVPPLAGLRTDLDRFEDDEAALLLYHGYWSMHTRLGALWPELAVKGSPQRREYAKLTTHEEERLRSVLLHGKKRRPWR